MKIVTSEHRKQILASIAEGIGQGEDTETLKLRREILARDLGYETAQVRAVSAWLKIKANEAIEFSWGNNKSDPKLRREDLIAFHAIYSSAYSDSDIAEAAQEFAVPTKLLEQAVQRYLQLLNRQEEKSPKVVDRLPKIPKEMPLGTGTEMKKTPGVRIDYMFSVKEQWRQKWADFIENNFTLEDRKSAKILFLPSPQVFPEFEHYRRLGFDPNLMFGVEGGSESERKLFTANAESAGIRPILGRLENIVPDLKDRFTIVSFDFIGQACKAYADIMSQTLLAPKAAVLLNIRGSRESAQTQETFDNFASIFHTDISSQLADIHIKSFDKTQAGKSAEEIYEESALFTTKIMTEREAFTVANDRDDLLDRMLISTLSNHRVENLQNSQLPLCVSEAKSMALLNFDASVLEKGIQSLGSFGFKVSPMVTKHFVLHTSLASPIKGDFERYKYFSEVSRAHSPFLSTFQIMHTPLEEYSSWRHTRRFFVACMDATYKDGIENAEANNLYYFTVRHKNMTRLCAHEKIAPSDQICFCIGNKTIAEIAAYRMFKDLNEYHKFVAGCDRGVDPKDRPRIILNPK